MTTYGAAAVVDEDDDRSDAPLKAAAAVIPGASSVPAAVAPAASSVPAGGEAPARVTSSKSRVKVVWEYEVHDGYTAFHDDCQKYMEKRYQEFSGSGGKSRTNIRTQGKNVSVDFERMSSKVENSHTIRKIRRSGHDTE